MLSHIFLVLIVSRDVHLFDGVGKFGDFGRNVGHVVRISRRHVIVKNN